MKSKIRFRHRVEYGAFRGAQALISSVPISWTGAFLSGILRVVFRVCWPLKRETISRIREVFGEDVGRDVSSHCSYFRLEYDHELHRDVPCIEDGSRLSSYASGRL